MMNSFITSCGVISAEGLYGPFCDFVRQEKKLSRNHDHQHHVIEDLNIVEILGKRKGTRVLDRHAALVVGATHLAVQSRENFHADYPGEDIGIVVGTLNGSIESITNFLKATHDPNNESWMVSPEGFPNTVMNFAAGQAAIWQNAKALNTTIAGGCMSGLMALKYADRALKFGSANVLLAGSAEEFSPISVQAMKNMFNIDENIVFGEAGAMFVIEKQINDALPGTRIKVLSCEIGYDNLNPQDGLIAVIEKSIAKAEIYPQSISQVITSGCLPHAIAEQAALELSLTHQPARYDITEHFGLCISATTSLAIAALIAKISVTPGAIGMTTCIGPFGNVGSLILQVV